MNEILGAVAFIRDRLVGIVPSNAAQDLKDAVGDNIYVGVAPQKSTYPLVIIQPYTSRDLVVVGGASAYLIADIIVRVVATNHNPLFEADRAIFKMLQTASGPVQSDSGIAADDLWVMGIHRVSTMSSDRSEGDTIYRSLMSTYRVRIQRTAS